MEKAFAENGEASELYYEFERLIETDPTKNPPVKEGKSQPRKRAAVSS